MEADRKKELLEKIESGYSLPVMSVVAVKLVEFASDDTCSVNDLTSLIEKDPSLAANLLRMANSAFFRTSEPVATLQQAIMRIGFHQLRIMALSLSLRNTFPMGRIGALDYEQFWRISLYRGLLAQSISKHMKMSNDEEAFLAGLILEIGLLIFFDIFLKNKNEGDEIAGSLKLELNKERDMLELMEKANRTLGTISEKISQVRTGQSLPSFDALDVKAEEKDTVTYTLQAVAHEIKNPLVAVAGFAKRLAKKIDPDSENGRYVRIILEEAMRLEAKLKEMSG